MTIWAEQVERRAKLIHDEISLWRSRAREMSLDPEESLTGLYALLRELYVDDLPLAQAKDNSDLLLHVEGRAVEGTPRLSLVSGLFNNVRSQVRDLTKAISGLRHDQRVSAQEIDLGLSGLAKGSLFVGFNVPSPRDRHGQANLLGTEDPLFRATRDALKIINTVSHTLEITGEDEATARVAQVIDDPKIRDAALVAVRRIAPSGRQGVSTISVTSSGEGRSAAQLTPEVRSQIGRMLVRPVTQGNEMLQFEGVVREIDLDARRFELRGITGESVSDIRCVYNRVTGITPKRLLDARVRVRGTVERRPDEAPRLIDLTEVEVISGPQQ